MDAGHRPGSAARLHHQQTPDPQLNSRARVATYRVQLHRDFDFSAAAEVVPYLAELGVSDLYCSPIYEAAAGSRHGYDVVDHSRINPELGDLSVLTTALDRHGMGLTIDVVPNHMAIDGRANRWWWDVLENGPSSQYATFFDIDWEGEPERAGHTVLVPVLGERYGSVLEAAELSVVRVGGSFEVRYYEHELPLSPRTYDAILAGAGLGELAGEFGALPHADSTDRWAREARHERKERLKDSLHALCDSDPEISAAIDRQLEKLHSDPDLLDGLLRRQNYRLAYWRVAREELDYRRFFNIESLVGLRVEDDQVFTAVHETTARLVERGVVDGLRVDHIDGLRDPEGYLQRLRRMAPRGYVVAEKILTRDESLTGTWPLDGTTGYDFLTRVNNLLVDPAGESDLTGCYSRLTGELADYRQVEREAKHQIMRDELAPEVDRLTRQLVAICDDHRDQRDRTRSELRAALSELLASFPVYRTYVHPERSVSPTDEKRVREAVAAAKLHRSSTDGDLLDFIGELLLLRWPGAAEVAFALAFPQVSAPVMAKGAEDTAFYRYFRLVSLNEVGGDPAVIGRPVTEFYEWCTAMAQRWPETMLTLDTHDTKRSADVRARINQLSEMPVEWEESATDWLEATDAHGSWQSPDLNIRYLFLQTLVGAWPIETDRMISYMEKAAREAKVHTSWADPNEGYEDALRNFVERSLNDDRFVASLEEFLVDGGVRQQGEDASLGQTALLLTCPGVPDLYQGAETWNNRLVDPDNRRPVDYAAIRSGGSSKAKLIGAVLNHRRTNPEAYRGFTPLSDSEELVAFARSGVVTTFPRRRAGGEQWRRTELRLPPGGWRPVQGGGDRFEGAVPAGELVGPHPVGVLVKE